MDRAFSPLLLEFRMPRPSAQAGICRAVGAVPRAPLSCQETCFSRSGDNARVVQGKASRAILLMTPENP